MSLYTEIVKRGIEHDHHESDLYIPYTAETKVLLDEHHKQGGSKASGFISKGRAWVDIPFAYDPYWQAEARREMKIPTNNT
jgi:hypothetical protein